ncbi:MAG: hypothetical protein D4R74_08070 [Betaproteobacteria bacterium]|nr:MAG: hypothetical protein D4R74_08070 [Betaproteobacteria bacterium]
MQRNIQANAVHYGRNRVAALSAALAISLAFAIPATGYAANDALAKADTTTVSGKASKKQQIVFHVTNDDPKIWNQSLNNMAQLQKIIGKDNIDIELVVNGYGIGMLKMDSVVGNRVNEAVAKGIKVVACEQTMVGFKLTKDDMLKSVDYVPGGVIEVMQKQQQGYAYLKP